MRARAFQGELLQESISLSGSPRDSLSGSFRCSPFRLWPRDDDDARSSFIPLASTCTMTLYLHPWPGTCSGNTAYTPHAIASTEAGRRTGNRARGDVFRAEWILMDRCLPRETLPNARAAATASFAWARRLFREFYIYKIVEGRYMLSNILYDAWLQFMIDIYDRFASCV